MIDENKLKEQLFALVEQTGDERLHIDAVVYLIDDAQNMDAVPVIRCDKCNFWDRDHISCEGLAKCLTGEGGIRYRNRSDFCSKGRKKDGGNHD